MAGSSIASLVVAVEANTVSFETGMRKLSDLTAQTARNVNDVAGNMRREFVSLAASVVSVGAAMQAIRSSINLGDELKQVADQTGVAIDKLDRLSIVAKLNGADLATVTTGFKGLGKAIVEAQDSTSKQAQLFSALGVVVKDSAGNLRGVEDVMGDVAKALSGIENEITRAQVGTALLGKGYLQMAATLRNYEADQQSANLVLEKFGGVSNTAANLADELGDRFTLLGEGSKRALLNGLVPGLAAVSQGINELINAGGSLQTGFGDVVSKVAEFVTGSLISLKGAFQVVGVSIAGVMAAIATGSLEPLRAAREEINRIEAEVNGARARIATAAKFPGLDDSDQTSRAASSQNRLNTAQSDGARLVKILGDATKATKAQIADYGDEIEKLRADMEKMTGGDGGFARLSAANLKIAADQRAGKIVSLEQAEAYRQLSREADELERQIKETAAAWDSYAKAAQDAARFQEEIDEAVLRTNLAIKAQNDALELEHRTLGLTDNARAQFIARLKLEQAQIDGNTNAVLLLTKQLDLLNQQAQDNALLDMAEQARAAFESATAFASDFFVDLFNNGTSAFKNLWENFKQLAFRALADIAAKQVVVSITGALGIGGSGLANAATGGGGGLLSGIGSLFGGGFGGGGGLLGAAGGFGAAQTAALDSALLTSFGGAFSSLAGGGLTAALGPVVAALPWAGLAAIAIPMIGKLFDKGPASRTATFASGDASLIADKSRDAVFQGSSAFGAFGIARDFWLGPEAGAAFKPTIDAITTLDNTIAAMVGGDLTRQITEALASHEITVGFGKEGTDINASGGPGQILKDRYVTVLNAIDTQLGAMVESFQGTGSELANFVISLVSLKQTLGETFKDLDTGQLLALGEAVGGIDKLAGSVAFLNANFLSQADQAAKAQQQLADDFAKLGLAVPATHQAFLDLLATFDLTTDSGRSLYASVLGLSQAFVQVNGTATDAAKALEQASDAIEQSTTQIVHASEAYFAVFGGKNPDSSKAQQDADKVEEMLALFANIAGQTTGNFGEELRLQIQLVTGAITDAGRRNLPGVATLLRSANSDFASSLRLFESLNDRYSDEIAEQLVKLTETYNKQKEQLRGNVQGLDALEQVYEEQWNAIINGTAAGVDGALSQLGRLQQGILDYVDSLRIGADSPLTATQKLVEAQRQYEETFAKASTGDVTALGDVTGAADAYIKLAREFYASSETYTALFNQVTGDLTALGTQDLGAAAVPMNAADQALLNALPTGNKLMSAEDMKEVVALLGARAGTSGEASAERIADAIIEAMIALAKSNNEDSRATNEELRFTRQALTEAFATGRK